MPASGGEKRRATSLMNASGAPEMRSGIVSAIAARSGSTRRVRSSSGKFYNT